MVVVVRPDVHCADVHGANVHCGGGRPSKANRRLPASSRLAAMAKQCNRHLRKPCPARPSRMTRQAASSCAHALDGQKPFCPSRHEPETTPPPDPTAYAIPTLSNTLSGLARVATASMASRRV